MLSISRHSPAGRKIADLEDRIARLDAYERWRPPTRIDFESILGREVWESYWTKCEAVIEDMRKCHEVAETIKRLIDENLDSRRLTQSPEP